MKSMTSRSPLVTIPCIKGDIEYIRTLVLNLVVISDLTKRFCASLKHNNVGQTKFIKPNSQR